MSEVKQEGQEEGKRQVDIEASILKQARLVMFQAVYSLSVDYYEVINELKKQIWNISMLLFRKGVEGEEDFVAWQRSLGESFLESIKRG